MLNKFRSKINLKIIFYKKLYILKKLAIINYSNYAFTNPFKNIIFFMNKQLINYIIYCSSINIYYFTLISINLEKKNILKKKKNIFKCLNKLKFKNFLKKKKKKNIHTKNVKQYLKIKSPTINRKKNIRENLLICKRKYKYLNRTWVEKVNPPAFFKKTIYSFYTNKFKFKKLDPAICTLTAVVEEYKIRQLLTKITKKTYFKENLKLLFFKASNNLKKFILKENLKKKKFNYLKKKKFFLKTKLLIIGSKLNYSKVINKYNLKKYFNTLIEKIKLKKKKLFLIKKKEMLLLKKKEKLLLNIKEKLLLKKVNKILLKYYKNKKKNIFKKKKRIFFFKELNSFFFKKLKLVFKFFKKKLKKLKLRIKILKRKIIKSKLILKYRKINLKTIKKYKKNKLKAIQKYNKNIIRIKINLREVFLKIKSKLIHFKRRKRFYKKQKSIINYYKINSKLALFKLNLIFNKKIKLKFKKSIFSLFYYKNKIKSNNKIKFKLKNKNSFLKKKNYLILNLLKFIKNISFKQKINLIKKFPIKFSNILFNLLSRITKNSNFFFKKFIIRFFKKKKKKKKKWFFKCFRFLKKKKFFKKKKFPFKRKFPFKIEFKKIEFKKIKYKKYKYKKYKYKKYIVKKLKIKKYIIRKLKTKKLKNISFFFLNLFKKKIKIITFKNWIFLLKLLYKNYFNKNQNFKKIKFKKYYHFKKLIKFKKLSLSSNKIFLKNKANNNKINNNKIYKNKIFNKYLIIKYYINNFNIKLNNLKINKTLNTNYLILPLLNLTSKINFKFSSFNNFFLLKNFNEKTNIKKINIKYGLHKKTNLTNINLMLFFKIFNLLKKSEKIIKNLKFYTNNKKIDLIKKVKNQYEKIHNITKSNNKNNNFLNNFSFILFLESFRFINEIYLLQDNIYNFRIKKNNYDFKKNILKNFSSKFYWLKRYFGNYNDRKIFIYNWFLFLFTKNIEILVKTLKFFFEELPFKKHKYILRKIQLLISYLAIESKKMFNFIGMFFKIKGKIGAGGNSRKRYLMYQNGYTSNSTKKLKLLRETFLIRTSTGVLNVMLRLSFY